MGDEEDHGVLAYVVDDGDTGQVDAEQYAREAAEDEGCKRPVGFPQRSETGCCQQALEDHGETCRNQQTRHFPHQPPHLCHNDPDSRDRHLYDEQASWAYQRPHHGDFCRCGDGEESGCREPDKWTVRIEFPLRISAYSNNKPLRISALN